MARTVTRNQTLEEFRSNYNGLAADVGTLSGLSGNISNQGNLVDAINAVGATPSDLVAILEALREAGALNAELIVI